MHFRIRKDIGDFKQRVGCMPIRIIDITEDAEYEDYLFKCLANFPFARHRRRIEYLKDAVQKGFHKKLLIFNGDVVGQIEYSPAEVSYYPITGKNLIVLNCIWVLRKAKGHNFGKMLLESMLEDEKKSSSIATIALENHWSPWFKKWQIERLGFQSLDSLKVQHKTKYKHRNFSIYLMWIRNRKEAVQPTWNKQKLLEGIPYCIAHPLYHPQSYQEKCILNPVNS